MNIGEYQHLALKTAIYPPEYVIVYPALALVGEAGEVANKVKKLIRDGDLYNPELDKLGEIAAEIGDVLWYCAALANDIGIPLERIAKDNLAKLAKRQQANKLHGSGDDRESREDDHGRHEGGHAQNPRVDDPRRGPAGA